MEILTDNPVFVRELRRRMRGRGLVVTLCLYIAAMCLGALLIIHWNAEQIAAQRFGSGVGALGAGHKTATDIGRSLSSAILGIQAILVLIVAPTITAAMVRSEKERQTFDFLRGTAISAPTYVVGALLSTVLYVALALFCALPVLMISYLYGGVSDLVETTFTFLGISVVLSSGGLLVSCATERGRTAHVLFGLVLALGLAGYYGPWSGTGGWTLFGWSTASPGGGASAASSFWGYTITPAAFSAAGCLVLSGLMLLVASRKLFSPEERALNYRQMAGLYLGGMLAAGMWTIATSQSAAATLAAGSPASPPPVLRVEVLLAGLVGLGVAVQVISLLSPADIGSERWKLRKRFAIPPWLDESLVFLALLSAGAVAITAGILGFVLAADRSLVLAVAPVAAFLAAHTAFCALLRRRVSTLFAAVRWALVADVLLLLIPAVLLRSLLGSSSSGGSAAADLMIFALSVVSPIEASRLASSASGDAAVALCSTALYGALAAGMAVLLWSRPRAVAEAPGPGEY